MKNETLAGLKRRVRVGAVLKLVHASYRHGWINVPRAVAEADTVQFGLDCGEGRVSFMGWPKASELRWVNSSTFTIQYESGSWLTYEITQEAPK